MKTPKIRENLFKAKMSQASQSNVIKRNIRLDPGLPHGSLSLHLDQFKESKRISTKLTKQLLGKLVKIKKTAALWCKTKNFCDRKTCQI